MHDNHVGRESVIDKMKNGSDPEDSLRNAFKMFDSENRGFLAEEYIKDLLEDMGDNFTADEIRQTWKEAPLAGGQVRL